MGVAPFWHVMGSRIDFGLAFEGGDDVSLYEQATSLCATWELRQHYRLRFDLAVVYMKSC